MICADKKKELGSSGCAWRSSPAAVPFRRQPRRRFCARRIPSHPDDASFLNSLAWLLATCAEDKYRNGQRAVTLAEKSVRAKRNANNLDTLAAAYAEVGRFEDAVKTQQEVINVAGKNHPELKDFNKRLEWYRQKKPWRQ